MLPVRRRRQCAAAGLLLALSLALAPVAAGAAPAADDPTPEQLIARLQGTSGRARVDLLNSVSKAHWGVSNNKAIAYGQEAVALARELGYPEGEAAALRNVGIGRWYADDYDAALANTLQATRIYERLNDAKGVAGCKNTLGTIYMNLERYDEALATFGEALALAERTGDEGRQGVVLQNIGTIYIGQEKLPEALETLHRACAIVERTGTKLDLATCLANIGGVERRLRHFDEAIAVNRRVIELATAADSKTRLVDAYTDIGECELELGHREAALAWIERGLQLAKQEGFKRSERDAEDRLAKLHEGWGHPEKALEHQKRSAEIGKAIFKDESAKALADVQVRYETEKKEQQIEIQRLELSRQRAVQFALLGILVLLVLLALASHGRYRAKRRAAELFEQMSRTDALTGLANRRAMNEAMERERLAWTREKKPFSVVLADIDHFKRFNDTYGHDVGDRVLVAVARAAKKAVREVDLVARWGGEEILVLAPGADEVEALLVAERIQERIRAIGLEHQAGRLTVTATFGAATWRGEDGVEGVVKRADEALYRGKEAGRDRIVAA
jgi:diguanylate cyclase (GGDEF)-like protein